MARLERISGYGPNRLHAVNELLTRRWGRALIKPGDVVFDLGANVGYHTRDFSELVGSAGLVHAFEPNPELWRTLLDIPNVRLWPVAVGNEVSVETFILPVGADQIGSLVDPREFLGAVDVRTLSVPQVTIDSLAEAIQRPVSFAKIDVERREFSALKGAVTTLNKFRPVIVYENSDPETEVLLSSMEYKIYRLFPEAPAQVCNCLASPNEKSDMINGLWPTSMEFDIFITLIETVHSD